MLGIRFPNEFDSLIHSFLKLFIGFVFVTVRIVVPQIESGEGDKSGCSPVFLS